MSDKRIPLPDTRTYRLMREGHRNRKGHALRGYLVLVNNGSYAELVRTCCKH